MKFIPRLIATGLYAGYVPIAPGTAGSILALFIYWLSPRSESFYFLIITAGLFLVGVWAATKVEEESGVRDNQIIVIDEIVGVFVTLLFVQKIWFWLILGCFLFRVFDILKPYPVKQVEKLPSGWGVMLDDVIAGIYSLISLKLIQYFIN